MFNQELTIVNKSFNKDTKEDEYTISHIKGFWSSTIGYTQSNTNQVRQNAVNVRILMTEKGYVEPPEFIPNSKKWTLRTDDYIIKGYIDTFSSIQEIINNYECMKIKNIQKKDYASLETNHFAISGE